MITTSKTELDRGALLRSSRFTTPGGKEEVHLSITPGQPARIEDQAAEVEAAYAQALARLELHPDTVVFRRLFASDLANQRTALSRRSSLLNGSQAAISLVEQPPLPGHRLALWAYHVSDGGRPLPKAVVGESLIVGRGALRHLWTTGLGIGHAEAPLSPAEQTREVFRLYEAELGRHQAEIVHNAVRTWIFVRDVDNNYSGMVEARRELFAERGLTMDTHYIASTGIEGRSAEAGRLVLMDAYSICGLVQGQLRYLEAPEHLGRTSDYGVTFERGCSVTYGDRRQLFISGTASIDRRGETLHEGDVEGQLCRTLENIEALLEGAGARADDLAQILVYLRDPADEEPVRSCLEARFDALPMVLVHAPICRPSWLVEIEGIALVEGGDRRWERF